jgi:hypothetical protein
MNPGMNVYGSIPDVMRFAMGLGELSEHCMQTDPIQEKEEQKTRKNISLRNREFVECFNTGYSHQRFVLLPN